MSNQISLEGRLFAENSSANSPATLIFRQGHPSLELIVGDTQDREASSKAALPINDLSIESRIGHIARKITLPDGRLFETQDNDGVDRLATMINPKSKSSFIHFLERPSKRLAVFAIASLLLIAGLVRYGVPAAAYVAAKATPASVIALMDAPTLKTVDYFLGPSKLDEAKKQTITKLFKDLTAHVPKDTFNYRLLFRDGGKLGANAFALPGGTIVMTDQLIEMAQDEDEIAGVLAHEITHVEKRHSMQQLYRIAGITIMISTITGSGDSVIEEVAAGGALLLNASHSRAAESEADHGGIKIMKDAGRDGSKLATILERMTIRMCGAKNYEKCGKTGWLSSHPGTIERGAKIRDLAK